MLLMWYPITRIDVKPSDLSRASSPDQIEMLWNAQKNKSYEMAAKQSNRESKQRALSEPISPKSISPKHQKIQSKDDEIVTILRTNTLQNKHQIIGNFSKDNDLNTVLSDILSD